MFCTDEKGQKLEFSMCTHKELGEKATISFSVSRRLGESGRKWRKVEESRGNLLFVFL